MKGLLFLCLLFLLSVPLASGAYWDYGPLNQPANRPSVGDHRHLRSTTAGRVSSQLASLCEAVRSGIGRTMTPLILGAMVTNANGMKELTLTGSKGAWNGRRGVFNTHGSQITNHIQTLLQQPRFRDLAAVLGGGNVRVVANNAPGTTNGKGDAERGLLAAAGIVGGNNNYDSAWIGTTYSPCTSVYRNGHAGCEDQLRDAVTTGRIGSLHVGYVNVL